MSFLSLLRYLLTLLNSIKLARILAVDYGTKRVGLAVTDPLQLVASPLETVHAKDVIAYLQNYIKTEEVELFVVGKPLNRDGSPTDATPHVQGFIRNLRKKFPEIEIQEEDERFTSKMAQQALIQGGMKKKKRRQKGNLDRISAVIILQSYLERKSFGF